MTKKNTTNELLGMIREFFHAYDRTNSDGRPLFRITATSVADNEDISRLDLTMKSLREVAFPPHTASERGFEELADRLHSIMENFSGETCFDLSRDIHYALGQEVVRVSYDKLADGDSDVEALKDDAVILDDIEVIIGPKEWRTLRVDAVVTILRNKAKEAKDVASATRQAHIDAAFKRGSELEGGAVKVVATAAWRSEQISESAAIQLVRDVFKISCGILDKEDSGAMTAEEINEKKFALIMLDDETTLVIKGAE